MESANEVNEFATEASIFDTDIDALREGKTREFGRCWSAQSLGARSRYRRVEAAKENCSFSVRCGGTEV